MGSWVCARKISSSQRIADSTRERETPLRNIPVREKHGRLNRNKYILLN